MVELPNRDMHWMEVDCCLAHCALLAYHPGSIISTDYISYDKDGEQWLILHDEKSVVLAIRGSDEPIDWSRNLARSFDDYKVPGSYCLVHSGFSEAAQIISKESLGYLSLMAGTRDLYITGHSKGGSTAAIMQLVTGLQASRVTCFAPAYWLLDGSGDAFAESPASNNLVCYANELDPVPFYPKYCEGGGSRRILTRHGIRTSPGWFVSLRRAISDLTGNLRGEHSMARYLELMEC